MSPMKFWTPLILASFATPALAAGDKPFFSLFNTDFAVTIGFVLFFSIILYLKVPGLLGGLLDKRADGIKAELDEARPFVMRRRPFWRDLNASRKKFRARRTALSRMPRKKLRKLPKRPKLIWKCPLHVASKPPRIKLPQQRRVPYGKCGIVQSVWLWMCPKKWWPNRSPLHKATL